MSNTHYLKRGAAALAAACAMLAPAPLRAADGDKPEIVYPIRKIGITAPPSELRERVIVKGDTVPLVQPERNFGRFDRGLFNYLFISKGQWAVGMTASYGSLNTKDIQVLDILSNFDFDGEMYSIKPYVSYAFRNNSTVGFRFNYSRASATLANMAFDIDDDLNFTIADVLYKQNTYGLSVFYRHYIGLNRSKLFGVFNEVELGFSSGSSTFRRNIAGVPKETHTTSTSGQLNFCPGVTVFLMDYVSFNVSFGVFGVHFTNEKQTTDGVSDGSRFTSGANFRFNIFNINFGMAVHI